MTARLLIVNADDFGISPGVNRGVIEAHERGVVTSATLMVRGRAAEAAAAYARACRTLSVGLHVDLGEWRFGEDEWKPNYEVVDLDDAAAVTRELDRQLYAFEELVGRPPTHLDSHQHVHRDEPARSALGAAAFRLGVPVRGLPLGVPYSGAFYGQEAKGKPRPQDITVEALVLIVEALPAGLTELGCHPSAADDLDTMYRRERLRELETLCHARVRAAIEREGVVLCNFGDLPAILGR